MSKDKKEIEEEFKNFMHKLIENVADEMQYYIYETMGAEYDPIIRDNQNKIKTLEKRIKNMKNAMKNIKYDDEFKEFMTYHNNFFMASVMFSYATGLPIKYNVPLFEEDGKIVMEDYNDY